MDIFDELLLDGNGSGLGGVRGDELFKGGLLVGDSKGHVFKLFFNPPGEGVLGDGVGDGGLAEVVHVHGTGGILGADAPGALDRTGAPVLHLLSRTIVGLPVGPGSIVGRFLFPFGRFGGKGAGLEHRLGGDGYRDIVGDGKLGKRGLLLAALDHVNVIGEAGLIGPIDKHSGLDGDGFGGVESPTVRVEVVK